MIRLYDPQFRLLHKQSAPGGKQPFAVRFSPDGEKIAVGFADSTAVNVLAAEPVFSTANVEYGISSNYQCVSHGY